MAKYESEDDHGHKDDDVYDEDDVEDELEDDELDDNEAGMMEGFDRDEDRTIGGKKKKK